MSFRTTEKLKLIHADVMTPLTPGGKCYFLLTVDDFSRYLWLVLLSTKDEVVVVIRRVKVVVEGQSSSTLWTLRVANGCEFTAKTFDELYVNHEIQRHQSAPYSPQHDGVVE